MIRLILVCLWILILFVPVGLPVLLILWIIGLFSPALKDRLTMRYVVLLTGGITFLSGEKITAIGTENIPKDEAVLFISNHRSFFDIFTAYRYFKGCCGCVAKIEWKKIPILYSIMRNLHCIFLDRSSTREGLKATMLVTEELRSGRSFWICPEGTRSHGEALLPFREGSFRSAFQSGKRIVPITFTHTDDLFEKHLPWVRPAAVTIDFGAPIDTAGLSKSEQKALIAFVREQIQSRYDELK